MRTGIRHIAVLLLILSGYAASAQLHTESRMDFIQADIQRIDKLDGKEDRKLQTHDSARNALAYHAFFVWPDSIDNYIKRSNFSEADKKIYRDCLFRSLRGVYGRGYYRARFFDGLFAHLYKEVKGIKEKNLHHVLWENIPLSVQTISMYRNEPVADTFLCYAARIYPDWIFSNVEEFGYQPYAQHVIEYTAKYAPQLAKKYFLNNDPVYNLLRRSDDTAVTIILQITDDIGKKSNAYVLLDDIAKGKLTIKQADSIGLNTTALLTRLMNIRKQKSPLAEYSLEKELEVQALKFVRKVNDLHNEEDPVRFATIDKFSADQLYTLIVYSQEEIFTSTFNGIYKKFIAKLGKRDGFQFIQSMGDNRFRVFIKQCAAYGYLDAFLRTMTPEKRKILLIKFAAGLDREGNDVSQAVEVADAYTSIRDTTIRSILQRTIAMELERVTVENDKKGMAIYGLLSNLFVKSTLFKGSWYENISDKYKIPPIDVYPSAKLFESNKACIWHMYFYDDEDGGESFRAFLNIFRDPSWTIDESNKLFVKITSKGGKPIEIFANRPKEEYNGQAYLEHYFDSLNITPDVLIHRGHSYYAYKTIEKTKPGTKIFVLGSCGGYHNLSNIIEKAPDVNIISSKQIGVYAVNNPILKELADNMRKGTDINWQQLWMKVDARLKGSKDYGKFQDYIPPHKNLGAIFIRAYNKLIETN
jgi:hypothetical protein